MKHYGLLIAAIVCLGASARANDSAFSGVSGTPKPMQGEHRSIAMQSEKIVITTDGETYQTTVDFVFRNDGGASSVQMGFPETSYGDVKSATQTAFLRFATWVDGDRVPATRLITRSGEGNTEAYWLKTVTFGPKQTRRVRVSYASPLGTATTWGLRNALAYNFTGQNWKGKVKRSDLEIRVTGSGLWTALPIFEGKPVPMTLETGAKSAIFRKTWRDWQAQGDFNFGLTRTVPFWMLDRGSLETPPEWLRNTVTFRVGTVPAELPRNIALPPAFTRNGVTYISLPHLKNRLDGFGVDLKRRRRTVPKVDLKWNAQTGVSTLVAGPKTLNFAPQVGSPAPVLLRGQYGNTLYVPLAPVAKTLGLSFQLDPKNRLFDLKRGTWSDK